MHNPFDVIIEELHGIKGQLSAINSGTAPQSIEIINRDVLCKRLDITEPTAIRWEKKGKIPSIRIGSNVRYNWPAVIDSLENKGGK